MDYTRRRTDAAVGGLLANSAIAIPFFGDVMKPDGIFTCDCGVRTRHPYRIGTRFLCVDCANDERPKEVGEAIANDWRRDTAATWKSRSGGPGWSRKTG